MNKIMEIGKAIKVLREHNKWRRGSEDTEMCDPKSLGDAIDSVVNYFGLLELVNTHPLN